MAKQFTESRRKSNELLRSGIVKRSSAPVMYRTALAVHSTALTSYGYDSAEPRGHGIEDQCTVLTGIGKATICEDLHWHGIGAHGLGRARRSAGIGQPRLAQAGRSIEAHRQGSDPLGQGMAQSCRA